MMIKSFFAAGRGLRRLLRIGCFGPTVLDGPSASNFVNSHGLSEARRASKGLPHWGAQGGRQLPQVCQVGPDELWQGVPVQLLQAVQGV